MLLHAHTPSYAKCTCNAHPLHTYVARQALQQHEAAHGRRHLACRAQKARHSSNQGKGGSAGRDSSSISKSRNAGISMDYKEWQATAARSGQQARRMKLTVAYDGSQFAGFQLQAGKVRTVQGELERAAQKVFIGCSRMVGASRTDAGAHAYGQVVHFDVLGIRDSLDSDLMFFNAALPADLKALQVEYAADGFDSHFSCIAKTYQYMICCGVADPLQANRAWWPYQRHMERARGPPLNAAALHLDVTLIQEALSLLLGTHDFSALMDTRRAPGRGSVMRKKPRLAETGGVLPQRSSDRNVRTIGDLQIQESQHAHTGAQQLTMSVTGDGFLFHMVRVLVAALLEVGARRLTPQQLAKAVAAGDRAALPEAAPPHGLYLQHVWYPEDREKLLCSCTSDVGRLALQAALEKGRGRNVELAGHSSEQEDDVQTDAEAGVAGTQEQDDASLQSTFKPM